MAWCPPLEERGKLAEPSWKRLADQGAGVDEVGVAEAAAEGGFLPEGVDACAKPGIGGGCPDGDVEIAEGAAQRVPQILSETWKRVYVSKSSPCTALRA